MNILGAIAVCAMKATSLAFMLCMTVAVRADASEIKQPSATSTMHPMRAPKLASRMLHHVFTQRVSSQKILLTTKTSEAALGLYLVRFDSKVSSNGYCGAGNEDFLVLAKFNHEAAHPLAWERIQSCLESQSLYITDGNDFEALVRHLQIDTAHCSVSFEPLTEGRDPIRTYRFVDAWHAKLVSTPFTLGPGVACASAD